MRYALFSIGAIVLVMLAVVVTGYLLPVGHTAVREATFPVPAPTLYALIDDPGKYPSWRSGVTRVELLAPVDGRTSFREISRHQTITYVVDSATPDRALVTRIADKSLPFGGSWTYELTPTATGTMLRITEHGEVYNPVFRFVSRFVLGQTATMDAYLADVGKAVSK